MSFNAFATASRLLGNTALQMYRDGTNRARAKSTSATFSALFMDLGAGTRTSALRRYWQWNTLEILADDTHIQLKLNGVTTIDTHDSASSSGVIALQLHAGPEMRVDFRNMKLKQLP